MTRVITAIVGIPLVILLIQYLPAIYCNIVLWIVMILALMEYFLMVKESVPGFFRWPGIIAASAVFWSFYFSKEIVELPLLIFPAAVLLILTIALFSKLELNRAFVASALTLFGIYYVAGLMGFMVGIREIQAGGELGADLLLLLFCILWAGDSFAFIVGKSLGRHKLAPVVSPKKTIEGAIAGFVFSIVAAVGGRSIFLQQISLMDAVVLGAIVGILGQIGDLCESILKRAVQMKDSGTILPGHGGMLDRIDSLLFGAPALYYYWYLVLRS